MDDWQEEFNKALAGVKSLVVLGVGNEIMGDDAAGVLVARQLRKIGMRCGDGPSGLDAPKENAKIEVVVYEAGTTPENFTGPIERIRPDLVLIIDAADMGRPVGEVAWLEPERMGSMMHGTHTMPLSFLAEYIRRTSGAGVAAIGIQAGRINMDSGPSPEVARACNRIVQVVKQAIISDG